MDYRIKEHPILEIPKYSTVKFTFDGKVFEGIEGEVISSALFANGIKIFGTHHKDNSPQGIFCANGQCSQCMVLVDGLPVKACMTPLKKGMNIKSCNGLPELPSFRGSLNFSDIETLGCQALIIGAGPSGLAAAIEIGKNGIDTILLDDKSKAGGKLLLQTHKFFGSVEDCYAGTRGVDIAEILAEELKKLLNVRIFLNSTACAVFSDKKVGVVASDKYKLISFEKLLISTGAREKSLVFPGSTLPDIYGAGAFQTLVNRDFVKPASKLFIIGGGNVGLIAAYHAIQAGIPVIGLAEACSACGGYKVHEDKIRRLGVPIYLSHTVVRASGVDSLQKITIAEVDKNFKKISGTEKTFDVDTLLVAVGLNPVNEFYRRAKEFGFDVWSAGDAEEIAEASSAMFSGKIAAAKILNSFGKEKFKVPEEWVEKSNILKSRPGPVREVFQNMPSRGVFPQIHCAQEIPCNPCVTCCPKGSIRIKGDSLMGLPEFEGECSGCGMCVAICPGLAITLVDFRENSDYPLVTVPFEMESGFLEEGKDYPLVDRNGKKLGVGKLLKFKKIKKVRNTYLVTFGVEANISQKIVSFVPFKEARGNSNSSIKPRDDNYKKCDEKMHECVVCRCERVGEKIILEAIKSGIRDFNQLKAITRATMGACGGKTCTPLIERIFIESGISLNEATSNTIRPLFVEVPIGTLAGIEGGEKF